MEKNNSITYLDLERLVLFIVFLGIIYRFAQVTVEVLILFTLVFLLFLLLNPLVAWLEKKYKLKRIWASLITVLGILLILAIILAFVVPPIIEQVSLLVKEIPTMTNTLLSELKRFSNQFPFLRNISSDVDVGKFLSPGPVFSGIAKVGQNFISVIFFSILGVFLVIFMLANPKPIITGFLQFFPKQKVFRVREAIILLSQGIARWFTSSLIIGTINGLTVFIGFLLIGIRFSFLFGLLYILAEFIPYIGPLSVAIIAVLFALSQSLVTAVLAIIILIIVQVLEATVWSPLILSQRLSIHPISVVFTILAGEAVLGFMGALLAVPILLTIKIFYYEFYERPFPPGFLATEAEEVMEMDLRPEQET